MNHLSDHQIFATEELPLADRVQLRPTRGWKDPERKGEDLESEIFLGGKASLFQVKPKLLLPPD